MHDLIHNLGVVPMLAPAVLSATTTSEPVDLIGFDSGMVVVQTGAIVGAGDFTAKLQDSETGAPDDFTDVDSFLLLDPLPASLPASATVKIGSLSVQRFVRVVITKNSGTSIAASVVAVKGHPRQRPVV